MDIPNNKIKDIINETLNIGESNEILSESYVAQQKMFNIRTEFLSPDNVKNHIELYDNYVKSFNRISAELDAADRKNSNSNHSNYRSLKIDETYNLNAVYLHELYFANIGDNKSQIKMDSLAFMRIERDFGTFDAWQKDFIACCMASRCGWAITYLNTFTKSYMNVPIDLHSLNVPFGAYPVIVMDVWQHAYYRDYLKDIKTYVFAMMKQLNWRIIEKRFEKADKIIQALRS